MPRRRRTGRRATTPAAFRARGRSASAASVSRASASPNSASDAEWEARATRTTTPRGPRTPEHGPVGFVHAAGAPPYKAAVARPSSKRPRVQQRGKKRGGVVASHPAWVQQASADLATFLAVYCGLWVVAWVVPNPRTSVHRFATSLCKLWRGHTHDPFNVCNHFSSISAFVTTLVFMVLVAGCVALLGQAVGTVGTIPSLRILWYRATAPRTLKRLEAGIIIVLAAVVLFGCFSPDNFDVVVAQLGKLWDLVAGLLPSHATSAASAGAWLRSAVAAGVERADGAISALEFPTPTVDSMPLSMRLLVDVFGMYPFKPARVVCAGVDAIALVLAAASLLFYGDVALPRVMTLAGCLAGYVVSSALVPTGIRLGYNLAIVPRVVAIPAVPMACFILFSVWGPVSWEIIYFRGSRVTGREPLSPFSRAGWISTGFASVAIGFGLRAANGQENAVAFVSYVLVAVMSILTGLNWAAWLYAKATQASFYATVAIATHATAVLFPSWYVVFNSLLSMLPYNGGLDFVTAEGASIGAPGLLAPGLPGHVRCAGMGNNYYNNNYCVPRWWGTVVSACLVLYCCASVPEAIVGARLRGHITQLILGRPVALATFVVAMYLIGSVTVVQSAVSGTIEAVTTILHEGFRDVFSVIRLNVAPEVAISQVHVVRQVVIASLWSSSVEIVGASGLATVDSVVGLAGAVVGAAILQSRTVLLAVGHGTVVDSVMKPIVQFTSSAPTVPLVALGFLVQHRMRWWRTHDPNSCIKRAILLSWVLAAVAFAAAMFWNVLDVVYLPKR